MTNSVTGVLRVMWLGSQKTLADVFFAPVSEHKNKKFGSMTSVFHAKYQKGCKHDPVFKTTSLF